MRMLRVIALIVLIAILAALSFLGRTLWYTSTSQMVGEYKAQGAWGESVLTVRANHTFQQSVKFTNQFNGKTEGTKSVSGDWAEKGRTLLSRKIEFSSFISPSPLNGQAEIKDFSTTYGALGTSFGIEVDPGAGIYYWKLR